MMGSSNVKVAKVRELLKEKNLDAALISNQDNFSWLSDGGRGHVSIASEASVASLFVTPEEVYLIADNIESHSLQDEEPGDFECMQE